MDGEGQAIGGFRLVLWVINELEKEPQTSYVTGNGASANPMQSVYETSKIDTPYTRHALL